MNYEKRVEEVRAMATITRLKGVEQNKEFDRVLVRQLNFRTGSNNPIPANQVLFSDGSGGTYWADPSGNYSARAFNEFRVGTNGVYYSTVATGTSNILKLESGYGIGMYKSDSPESNSFFIYNTGPSRIQTQAGGVEFSSLSTTTSGRVLNFVGLGNTIVTASSNYVFFESASGFTSFSTINADYVSTNNLTFNNGFGNTLTVSSLTVSTLNVSSSSGFSGSSIATSSIFATNLDTSTLRFSTGIGNNLSVSSAQTSTLSSLYASFVSSFANSMVISSLIVSSINISTGAAFNASSITTSSIFATNLDTSTLEFSTGIGNNLSISSLSISSAISLFIQASSLSTNNLSTNNLVGNFGLFSSISSANVFGNFGFFNSVSTNNISTNNLIGNYGAIVNLSTNNISTNSIQTNNFSSINANFISSFADSMVISSLVVSSINISTSIPIGSTLQLSTLNGFSSPIITMHWETGYVGINLGESTPQTALDVNGIIYAQNIVTYSDQRLKENFEYANFNLDLLTNLRPQRFEWKKDHSKDFGLIAQQVESILPECVETDLNGYKLVSYQKLVPVAFDLIHNLACKVSTLESIISKQ